MWLSKFLFALVLLAATSAFAFSARRLIGFLSLGRHEERSDRPFARLGRVVKIAFAQTKLLRDPIAGTLHLAIFWGFVVLLFAVLQSIVEGLTGRFPFAFLGDFYPAITFSQEIFCVLVICATVVALLRRFVFGVGRLQVDKHGKLDAALILVWILFIVTLLLLQDAARISIAEVASGKPQTGYAYPISSHLASWTMFRGMNSTWERVFWWSHIVLVLGFLNYLPYSKHLHVLTSLPNVYFSKLTPRGALSPLNLEDESVSKFGVSDIEDLTWKQLLDGYTCTECGRCDSVCPAHLTGKPLSPRKIIVDTRRRTMEKSPVLINKDESDSDLISNTLLDHFISEDELWACTTCMACVYECPVTIEHVDEIMGMRRSLVLNESRFPPELRTTFENLERNYTPWAFSHSSRADWTKDHDIKMISETGDAEILFWVGCAGAYDSRYKNVTQAFSKLMAIAGVKFAILGTEEKCTGDPARRMGNEYLAQTLMKENVETLNRHNIRKIVTTCPHCFHSLKKEYPQFGGAYEVIHHTEFLMQLVQSGKLKVSQSKMEAITIHDSCYLARYNGIIDPPREILKAIPGLQVVEMSRSKDRGFCCGAGGGRMWMEEKQGKRINAERTEEAMATKAGTIGTACPFCMTMMTDGVKSKDASGTIAVKDIAELLLEAVQRDDDDQ
jgi:Fe-S oxidoreductase